MLAWGTPVSRSTADGLLPGGEGLPGEAGDQVEIEVGDSSGAEALEVVEHDRPAVQAAALMRFAIDEGLNAEADAIDAGLGERVEGGIGELAGSALDRDLGIGLDGEFGANGGKEPRDQVRREQAGRSAAEIDRVDAGRQVGAKVFAPLARAAHLIDEALNVARMFAGRIDA